ncbi:probable Umc1-MADS-box homolog Umc1 [Sporisorium reilianum SRZ2]|uniref:Probable Umc1-MADS-box homolog Umc1 n=1 Tax=Sporisorium reilianum (strain SRZ2) TaxID=999809 RepID=E6ZTS4_SPORE|nr:probable Umc1-MADS-box homolog Umc1 [Sporisorium reilianum SRZ2]
MSTLSAGVVGVRQPGSTSQSPVYELPFGTVQLASSSNDGSANFDLASGFAASAADYDNQEEEDDEEGDDDDGDSDDGGKGKGKKGKRARSEAKGERDLKTGRRKIKIEFIQDDARRHITFSKRKAGIMKKAYELATLTGTQVLLLVVSQTGLVYTFTTPKLQALVTQAEGRNLIQACLNAPDPPNAGAESGHDDPSADEGSDADDGLSPSESHASSNKRAAQNRKRPRTASTSKSSSTPASAASGAAPAAGAGGDDEAASGSQPGTAKRGRGRPRKNTSGQAASSGAAADASHPPMPPPPAMHQSFSDDAVHQHQQQQQHHQQHAQHPPQYTHVPSADFSNYAASGFYGDASASAANHDLGFGQAVDANQAAWQQTMSPNANQGMFGTDPHQHHRHHQPQQPASQPQPQQPQQPQPQQQQQQAPQFNYAAQHFGHFSPQQMAGLPQEIQAPRPAW